MPNKPLDTRLLSQMVVDDDDPQLEIMHTESEQEQEEELKLNSKYEKTTDHQLQEDVRRNKDLLNKGNLRLKDDGNKFKIKIAELEQELRVRKRLQEKKAASGKRRGEELRGGEGRGGRGFEKIGGNGKKPGITFGESDFYGKSDCSGRCKKDEKRNGIAFDEEVEVARGKAPFSLISSKSERCTFDEGGKIDCFCIGEAAGPSGRVGLRSSFKPCRSSNGRIESKGGDEIGNVEDSRCWEKAAKRNHAFLEKEDPVVELFSSEDEEEKENRQLCADFDVANVGRGDGIANAAGLRTERIAYPSRDDPEAVEVHYHDLHRLEPLEFLNDTVIDFYIKYIQRPEVLKKEHKSKFYFFNSFFYKKLSEVVGARSKKAGGPDLSKLRKWTKGTNIFEKEYLFIPIHGKWHWSLAIICHPGASSEDSGSERCILHLDSMSPGHKSTVVFRLLRIYLLAEWEHQAAEDGLGMSYQKLTIDDFSTKKVPVPQQENESDCGLFLLHYIECFLRVAPSSFKMSDIDQGKLFGKSWFKPSKASALREQVHDLLEGLFQNEENRVTENAEAVEKVSSPPRESEGQLRSDTSRCNSFPPETNRPLGRSSVTEAVDEEDRPASACLGSRDLRLSKSEQHVDGSSKGIDEECRPSSSIRGNSSGRRISRPREPEDPESPIEPLQRRMRLRGRTPDGVKVRDALQVPNLSPMQGFEVDNAKELHLVVDLTTR